MGALMLWLLCYPGQKLPAVSGVQAQGALGETLPQCWPQGPGPAGQNAHLQSLQAHSGGRRPGPPLLGAVLWPRWWGEIFFFFFVILPNTIDCYHVKERKGQGLSIIINHSSQAWLSKGWTRINWPPRINCRS